MKTRTAFTWCCLVGAVVGSGCGVAMSRILEADHLPDWAVRAMSWVHLPAFLLTVAWARTVLGEHGVEGLAYFYSWVIVQWTVMGLLCGWVVSLLVTRASATRVSGLGSGKSVPPGGSGVPAKVK